VKQGIAVATALPPNNEEIVTATPRNKLKKEPWLFALFIQPAQKNLKETILKKGDIKK